MNDAEVPVIDARGLSCPQPVFLLRQALRECVPGARVRLLATDPLAQVDVEAFCLRLGHRLISATQEDAHWRFDVARVA